MLSPAAPMFLNQGGTVEANTPIADLDAILAVGEQYNIVTKADTLEELASKLGVDVTNLTTAAAEYTSAANGEVEDSFGKDASLMSSLAEGSSTPWPARATTTAPAAGWTSTPTCRSSRPTAPPLKTSTP